MSYRSISRRLPLFAVVVAGAALLAGLSVRLNAEPAAEPSTSRQATPTERVSRGSGTWSRTLRTDAGSKTVQVFALAGDLVSNMSYGFEEEYQILATKVVIENGTINGFTGNDGGVRLAIGSIFHEFLLNGRERFESHFDPPVLITTEATLSYAVADGGRRDQALQVTFYGYPLPASSMVVK